MDLKRRNNESNLQYIWRVCSEKDQNNEITWDELARYINQELNITTAPKADRYRKPYQQAKAFYDEVFSKFNRSEEYLEEVERKIRELESAKIAFRDERNAWQKQNYTAARVENKLNILEKELLEIGKKEFLDNTFKTDVNGDNDLLAILSDLHIGQSFSSHWGEYNISIAEKRMKQYANEIISIKNLHNSENLYLSIQGDLISGNIHKSIAVTNSENVIKQIKIATELIVNFIYSLIPFFKNIYVTSVSGNHSRIDRKDDALHDERLDDLVAWGVSALLCNIKNVHIKSSLDTGIALMNIRDKYYVNVHGDYDSFDKNGVSNLALFLECVPYAITFGHKHTCALKECNGVKMIQGGSLSGSGDQHTVEKRIYGKPSQMVCVCTEKGIKTCYPIELE